MLLPRDVIVFSRTIRASNKPMSGNMFGLKLPELRSATISKHSALRVIWAEGQSVFLFELTKRGKKNMAFDARGFARIAALRSIRSRS